MVKITITEEKFQWTYKQHNGLKPHKYIDWFNQRTGRIKRMRTRHYSKYNKRRKVQKYLFLFRAWDFYPPIHRWNRH